MLLIIVQTIIIRTPQATIDFRYVPLWFLREGRAARRDIFNQIAANAVMFVPIGFLTAFYLNRCSILLGFIFSCSIELLQLITHRGVSEIDDVISNTVGTIIGFVLYLLFATFNDKYDIFSRLKESLRRLRTNRDEKD